MKMDIIYFMFLFLKKKEKEKAADMIFFKPSLSSFE